MKILSITTALVATLQAMAGELVSPNGQYRIEYLKVPTHESNVRLKNAKSGKVLGYAFSNGYEHSSYLETAWSPDSRYLAVIERGIRTAAEVSVFAFSGDTVEQIRLPDYRLNLLGRRELVDGGRYHWVSKLRWEATRLTFFCTGQWIDGPGDPEIQPSNWYHFDVSLAFGGSGNVPDPRLVAVTVIDQKK